MMRISRLVTFFLAVALLSGACAAPATSTVPPTQTAQPGPVTLTVMTHDSFAASKDVIAAFEQQNNVKLSFLKSGDAGAALNRAILSKAAPLADVF